MLTASTVAGPKTVQHFLSMLDYWRCIMKVIVGGNIGASISMTTTAFIFPEI
jgi:hypothetical protein